jgi:type IV fimbrial biogenesis protein FimT
MRGFTLLELMTAVLVLGILIAMAAPSFRDMSRNNRIAATQNDLVTALAVARSEALRSSTKVSVCPSSDSTDCSGDTDWSVGWIVFTDAGDPGEVDDTDEVVQAWPGAPGDTELVGVDKFVTYAPTGILTPALATTFDIFAPGCRGANKRHVTISVVGSVSATRQNCS